MKAKLLKALFILLSTNASVSQADYVIMQYRYDAVQGPQTLFDVARDCTNNDLCKAALNIADYYSGIPISNIVAVSGNLAESKDGEGTYVKYTLPSGYEYCRSGMRKISVVPTGRSRESGGSTFLGRADPDGLYAESWTPSRQSWEGRSWVEADIVVVGVSYWDAASARESGNCYSVGNNRYVWSCRGDDCVDTVDRGVYVPGHE